MFFGSHEGARRGAILYSIAISCKLNGINLFEYISDVIEKTIEWQPNTTLEKYRDLLPDRWKKQQQHLFNQLLLLFLNYARYKRGDAYHSLVPEMSSYIAFSPLFTSFYPLFTPRICQKYVKSETDLCLRRGIFHP